MKGKVSHMYKKVTRLKIYSDATGQKRSGTLNIHDAYTIIQ